MSYLVKKVVLAVSYLVKEVGLVDVALVHQHAQVLPRSVDVDTLQLPRLELGALVAVEAQVPKPPELRRLVRIPVPHEQLDFCGDFALVR